MRCSWSSIHTCILFIMQPSFHAPQRGSSLLLFSATIKPLSKLQVWKLWTSTCCLKFCRKTSTDKYRDTRIKILRYNDTYFVYWYSPLVITHKPRLSACTPCIYANTCITEFIKWTELLMVHHVYFISITSTDISGSTMFYGSKSRM